MPSEDVEGTGELQVGMACAARGLPYRYGVRCTQSRPGHSVGRSEATCRASNRFPMPGHVPLVGWQRTCLDSGLHVLGATVCVQPGLSFPGYGTSYMVLRARFTSCWTSCWCPGLHTDTLLPAHACSL